MISNSNSKEDTAAEVFDNKADELENHHQNSVTSNAPPKKPIPAKFVDIQIRETEPSPSTSGPKGTEEPGSDKGPGGTGW